jgi:hypothetical protein
MVSRSSWPQGFLHESPNDRSLNHLLEAFAQLPKPDTDNDRTSIRHYPDFARKAGMKIVLAGLK